MRDFSKLPYRPGVGLMVLSSEGLIFVARRIDMPSEAWQMPQGGIDKGETPAQAAIREFREEAGTDKVEIIAESAEWLSYDLPEKLLPQLWGGRFRGQTQKWFVVRFTGTDDDIDIDTEHPEFLEWKWVELETIPDLIVPFKRRLYEDLVTEFGPIVRAIKDGSAPPA